MLSYQHLSIPRNSVIILKMSKSAADVGSIVSKPVLLDGCKYTSREEAATMRYEKLTYDKMNFLKRMNNRYKELLAGADRERMALRRRIQRLVAENDELRRNMTVCTICQENSPNRAFFACGHVTCCDTQDPCVNGHLVLEHCPICRNDVSMAELISTL